MPAKGAASTFIRIKSTNSTAVLPTRHLVALIIPVAEKPLGDLSRRLKIL